MTPILSFLPCAGASDASERPATSVATISQHTKRTDRYGNMGSSPESVGRQPLCAGIRSWSSDNVKRMDGGGFALIDRHLRPEGRPRAALCAIELRSPMPFSFEGFDAFNAGYRALLTEWKLLVDGENPIARTNDAPLVGAPSEPTFVVAGAGEMRERGVGVQGIVRHGETSPEAMREKAAHVMGVMQARLSGLDADWPDVTTVDVYTVRPLDTFLADTILQPAGAAAIHGVRWFPSRPPLVGLEYEMDLRGVVRAVVV